MWVPLGASLTGDALLACIAAQRVLPASSPGRAALWCRPQGSRFGLPSAPRTVFPGELPAAEPWRAGTCRAPGSARRCKKRRAFQGEGHCSCEIHLQADPCKARAPVSGTESCSKSEQMAEKKQPSGLQAPESWALLSRSPSVLKICPSLSKQSCRCYLHCCMQCQSAG